MLKLIYNWILVKLSGASEKKSAGGLYMPKSRTSDTLSEAVVYKVGPGMVTQEGVRVPPDVKQGDVVLFRETPDSMLQHSIVMEGENLRVITENDIVAVTHKLLPEELPEWLN